MLNTSLFKSDTQKYMSLWSMKKHFDFACSIPNSKNLTVSGIYALYHKYNSTKTCLYVGASIALDKRLCRFRANNEFDVVGAKSAYLKVLLESFECSQFFFGIKMVEGVDNIAKIENQYIKMLKPMFNGKGCAEFGSNGRIKVTA